MTDPTLDLMDRLAAARNVIEQRDAGGGRLPTDDLRPIATLRPGDAFRRGGIWHTIAHIDWRGPQCRVVGTSGAEFLISHSVQVPFRWSSHVTTDEEVT